jgi:hypothetical protein
MSVRKCIGVRRVAASSGHRFSDRSPHANPDRGCGSIANRLLGIALHPLMAAERGSNEAHPRLTMSSVAGRRSFPALPAFPASGTVHGHPELSNTVRKTDSGPVSS